MTKTATLLSPILIVFLLSFLFGCAGEKGEEQETSSQAAEVAEALKSARETAESETDLRSEIAATLGVDLAEMVDHESGLQWIVREEGTGPVPQAGDRIQAHYTGYLLNGTKFDSSVDRGTPFETEIGVGRVIQGWDIAFTDMKVGEKRVLFIPPELGYGTRGAGGRIPPNAELVFDVELLGILK
jgi:peptidylprolyl isomerase